MIKRHRLARFGILSAALLLIGIGLLRQEQQELLGKAVKICLECIGIG
ncbi:MAG: thioredoxin [Anaerotruncus sp.]|nr:thioredoxin [Anaerotruncus sp.]